MVRPGVICAALLATLALGAVPSGPPPALAQSATPPAEWDGLVRVRNSRVDAAYLLPGADFREFTEIMIDEPEVAIDQRWLRDFNRGTRGASGRLTDSDVQRGIEAIRTGFSDAFTRRFSRAGYAVVTVPGPTVMRIRPAIINIQVSAPDVRTSARSRTAASDAGQATIVLELRDSVTNALLGRAVDSRRIGNTGFMQPRNSVTNRADFTREFERWADTAIQGLEALREKSPFNPEQQ